MISQAKIKLIRSLESKKGRLKERAFVAEGPKTVGDLMAAMRPRLVVATNAWLENNEIDGEVEVLAVTDTELNKVSLLQHPQQVLAVFPLPDYGETFGDGQRALASLSADSLCLALDGVQDPGNLGTIIRIADWFGIETIYCSHETADVFNPKVVQATMGSIARVRVIYVDLLRLIDSLPEGYPVYGTLLDGEDIYRQQLSANGLIVMGNEGKGLSEAIRRKVSHKLLIPSYPSGRDTADSLNVAIATAITCSEFRRQSVRIRQSQ